MEEDFVTFKLAKKLQEKGFNKECFAHYDDLGNLLLDQDYWKLDSHILAPTISQALKWLREEKKLHIVIVTGRDIVTNTRLWGYKIWDLANHVWLHARIADNSYELAALSGIEFVIDNLI